jgi:hypothetical protein
MHCLNLTMMWRMKRYSNTTAVRFEIFPRGPASLSASLLHLENHDPASACPLAPTRLAPFRERDSPRDCNAGQLLRLEPRTCACSRIWPRQALCEQAAILSLSQILRNTNSNLQATSAYGRFHISDQNLKETGVNSCVLMDSASPQPYLQVCRLPPHSFQPQVF